MKYELVETAEQEEGADKSAQGDFSIKPFKASRVFIWRASVPDGGEALSATELKAYLVCTKFSNSLRSGRAVRAPISRHFNAATAFAHLAESSTESPFRSP